MSMFSDWMKGLGKKKVETEQDDTKFIATNDGNITLCRFGVTHSIDSTHPHHARIRAALDAGDLDGIDDLLDIPSQIETMEDVTVDRKTGSVLYRGDEVGGVIATKIQEMIAASEDFRPLGMFLSRVKKNPSRRAVEELWSFLENEGMAITEDGYFIAYKGVRDDFLDRHSGTFDNSPGQVLRMERNEVDDDCTKTCSHGFHVGSLSYATGWGTRVVRCKVDPADAVSVPKEQGSEKLRVCGYEVIEESKDLIKSPVYRDATTPPSTWDNDIDGDYSDEDEDDGYEY